MRLTGAIHIGPLHHLPEWQALGQSSPPVLSARPQHLLPAQSLSPSAENQGLKAKRGCHSGQSRLSGGEKKMEGGERVKASSAGVPGCCSLGSRGVSFKKVWRVRKGDNWIARRGAIPYSFSLSLEDSALGQHQAV